MFDNLRNRLLHFLKVPHEPVPPAGAPGSVRVFRAGKKFYTLRLLLWGVGQIGTLIAFGFSIAFLVYLREEVTDLKAAAARPAAVPETVGQPPLAAVAADSAQATSAPKRGKNERPPARNGRGQNAAEKLAARSPDWVLPLLTIGELIALLVYLIQIPITYAMVRLEYESHWYIVTDRSLRIRSGLVSLREATMSFANVQQVTVSQNPVQRLLGLSDVQVQSAGGGGGAHQPGAANDSMHQGVFRSVENGREIRDLILERLKFFRQAGLGDPDEAAVGGAGMAGARAIGEKSAGVMATETESVGAADVIQPEGEALTAARELLAEARALRDAAERSGS